MVFWLEEFVNQIIFEEKKYNTKADALSCIQVNPLETWSIEEQIQTKNSENPTKETSLEITEDKNELPGISSTFSKQP